MKLWIQQTGMCLANPANSWPCQHARLSLDAHKENMTLPIVKFLSYSPTMSENYSSSNAAVHVLTAIPAFAVQMAVLCNK